MSEQRPTEIQLTGKQLIFLFMSAVVLLVVVFLLGVSVGRGVDPALSADGIPAGEPAPDDTSVPAGAPAAAEAPVDLSFPAELTGRSGQSAAPATPPIPQDEVPPITPPAAAGGGAAAEAPPPPPPPAPAASTAESWFVQVGAFRSRDGANSVVADLTGKGHKALISTVDGLHRVRVGPFADRGAADRAAAELQKQGHPNGRVLKEGQ